MILYVLGFMFSPDHQQVLLSLKKRPEAQKGYWNGIGGKVDEEDMVPSHAIVREFHEATGVRHSDWEHRLNFGGKGYSVAVYTAYSTKIFDAVDKTDEDVQVFSVDTLPRLLPDLIWMLPMLQDVNMKFADVLKRD